MNDRIKTEDGLRYMHKIDLCKYFNNMSKTEIYAILNEISRERKRQMNEEYIKEEDVIMLLERMMSTLPKTIRANFATEMVKQIPRPDVVERKHGKWSLIRTRKTNSCPEHWLICSECEKYRVIKIGEAFPNYCENCGADMRGEKENG